MEISQPAVFYKRVYSATHRKQSYRSCFRNRNGSHDIQREYAPIAIGSARGWNELGGRPVLLIFIVPCVDSVYQSYLESKLTVEASSDDAKVLLERICRDPGCHAAFADVIYKVCI